MLDTADSHSRLHRTWFGELPCGWADDTFRRSWFTYNPAFDMELHNKFGRTLESMEEPVITPNTAARDALTLILFWDQLPRHLYRGTPRAFSFDPLAIRQAAEGLRHHLDAELSFDERAFFYMPFMHSEKMEDQTYSLQLFIALRDTTPKGMRHITGGYLRSAQEHHRIISKFSRFPHRNEILGRTSTPAEQAWLDHSSNRFGQAPKPTSGGVETIQGFVGEPDK